MKESIIRFVEGPFPKKYTAYVIDKAKKTIRSINFGDRRYQQFRDSTGMGLYSYMDHGDKMRRKNYFLRHSHSPSRKTSIEKESKNSYGYYTPKLLSHIYLW